MKQNNKWQVFLLSAVMLVALIGCQSNVQNPGTVISEHTAETSPSSTTLTQDETSRSIYNSAFEQYNDITELAVIINNPTAEDLSHLTTLETYGDEHQDSMLIIPKYNGSKITVSTAEYTGEQYIAKDDLFTNEATPIGYGLRLFANRPEGIPELIITISYEKVNRKYVVSSSGNHVEYLRVETDITSKKQGDLISAVQDATYVDGLNLFSSSDIDVDKDGENETVEVYCDGNIGADGAFLLDDGQNWALILRKGDNIFPLFDKAYIQLGKLQYAIYEDYDDYDTVHIIIEYKTGTAIHYYDCTYDDESGNMRRNDFFNANNINLTKVW